VRWSLRVDVTKSDSALASGNDVGAYPALNDFTKQTLAHLIGI
jgi:hypothetical protein